MNMENEILNKLQQIYNFGISVENKDIRYYVITCRINSEIQFNINFMYDCYLTLDGNIDYIVKEIDEKLPTLFKR